jgi:hypothetical protein
MRIPIVEKFILNIKGAKVRDFQLLGELCSQILPEFF